jgi:hypothetical protein
MKTSYIPPTQVISPKRQWSLIAVLDDDGEEGAALAIGRWDSALVLAMRWNGTTENPIGNPQSRGLPTWFIVPDNFRDAIVEKIAPDKKTLVRTLFQQEEADRGIVASARHDRESGKIIWRFPRIDLKPR